MNPLNLSKLFEPGDHRGVEFFHKGDCVVYQPSKVIVVDLAKVPAGTTGMVVGRSQAHDYYGRTRRFGRMPGTYLRDKAVIVQWDDTNVVEEVGAAHLQLTPIETQHLGWAIGTAPRSRHTDKDQPVLIRDLPATPVFEGDYVELSEEDHLRAERTGRNEYCVDSIDYHNLNRKLTKGGVEQDYPAYALSSRDDGGGSTMFYRADQIKLLRRGNVWFFDRGEYEKLTFKDLTHEASFFMSVNELVNIRNDAVGHYGWTNEQIRQGLKDGTVDYFSGAIYIDSVPQAESEGNLMAYKFMRFPEAAKRIREKLVATFIPENACYTAAELLVL